MFVLDTHLPVLIRLIGRSDSTSERGMTRPMKAAPRFLQGKRETTQQFLRRVEIETQKVLLKSKLSQKFGVCKVKYTDKLSVSNCR